MFLVLSVCQVRAEEDKQRGGSDESPRELGEDVGNHGSTRESSPHGESQGDRRVDVCPADGPDRVGCQHDGDSPDDRHLPEPALRPVRTDA